MIPMHELNRLMFSLLQPIQTKQIVVAITCLRAQKLFLIIIIFLYKKRTDRYSEIKDTSDNYLE